VPPTNPYDPYSTAPAGTSSNAGNISYPPSGAQAPQAPKRRTGLIIAVVVLVILILGGSIGGVFINHTITTQHANATATAVSITNASGTATTQVQQAATATIQAAATATAVTSIYPFSNDLVLNDPLTDNSKGAGWDNDGTFCKFAGSAYHVSDNQENTYQPCFGASTNYSNFTFQAEMEFTQGDDNTLAGLIFRGNKASNKLYRLVFDDQGDCNIFVSVDTGGSNTRDLFQSCSADNFNTGLDVTNTIAIVANGDKLTIYVNQEEITSVSDGTFSQGQIGFEVENQDSKNVEAIFNNAKLWKIS
jgi:hypothetical protein